MNNDEIVGRITVEEITTSKNMFNPINGWTRAKIIDQIWAKNNGKTCFDFTSEDCLYVNPEDYNRCAIGCFIPDEIYDDEMEGKGPHELLEGWPELKDKMPLEEEGLRALQHVHDVLKNYDDVSPDIRVPLQQWVEANIT